MWWSMHNVVTLHLQKNCFASKAATWVVHHPDNKTHSSTCLRNLNDDPACVNCAIILTHLKELPTGVCVIASQDASPLAALANHFILSLKTTNFKFGTRSWHWIFLVFYGLNIWGNNVRWMCPLDLMELALWPGTDCEYSCVNHSRHSEDFLVFMFAINERNTRAFVNNGIRKCYANILLYLDLHTLK